ncbi:MAG: carboxymuconolactone decarboxylase family protein [Rhizobiales bacterium]|nr:carboxymuconolactone decarboxylase family protein [Hyphomicrobiales bacterium]
MAKMPAPRLRDIPEDKLTAPQRALREAILAGPRKMPQIRGPFAVWLHAPDFGELAQRLGAHCRYKTGLEPRLSEFAILVTAQLWRAQFEWFAHAPIAAKSGIKPKTISDLRAGRAPKSAPKDERAIYDFVKELYKTRRVSTRTYARVQTLLGDAATVELVGLLGYYAMVAMTLNVFCVPLPPEEKAAFRE